MPVGRMAPPHAMTTAACATGNTPPRYSPIEDYALIGDCHGSALVSRDGSIDWAALHRFDADPVFCRLLDAGRGGFWSIRPLEAFTTERAYLPGTNILRTVFSTVSGRVAVTDFMPVGRRLDAGVNDYVHLNAPAWIVRRVEGLQGSVLMHSSYRPSCEFARKPVTLEAGSGLLHAGAEMPVLWAEPGFVVDGDRASAEWQVGAGQCRDMVLAGNTVAGEAPGARVDEFFEATRAFWEEWIGYCRYRGPFEEAVRRSALTLKLLTYAPTGAIVAAPTTSLPEAIGGERNWDYRFCWVRDSSFALYALSVLGYSGEAQCFHEFLLSAIARSLPEVRPMYGIDGRLKLDEATIDGLEGYRGSAPVRVGNGAYLQRQIDVYGQMLDLALMHHALGGRLDRQYRRLLTAVAKFIAAHWREPDQGIWEMRGPPRHHVHGKLMSWVGLDRAASLLDDAQAWREAAKEVADDIHAHGVSAASGAITQAYDGGTDAAVLLAPMLGFVLTPSTLAATIEQVRAVLGHGDHVARYVGEDGAGRWRRRFPGLHLVVGRRRAGRGPHRRRARNDRSAGGLRQRCRPVCRRSRADQRRDARQPPAGADAPRPDRQHRQPATGRAPRQRRAPGQLRRPCAPRGQSHLRLARRACGNVAVVPGGQACFVEALEAGVALNRAHGLHP